MSNDIHTDYNYTGEEPATIREELSTNSEEPSKYETVKFWSTHIERFLTSICDTTKGAPIYEIAFNFFKFAIYTLDLLDVICIINKRQNLIEKYNFNEKNLSMGFVISFDDGISKLQHTNSSLLWIVDNWYHTLFGGTELSVSCSNNMVDKLIEKLKEDGFITSPEDTSPEDTSTMSEAESEIRNKIANFVLARRVMEAESSRIKSGMDCARQILLDMFLKEITAHVYAENNK